MGGGYNIVASFLIFFFLFIYFTWFGVSMMIEKDKENKIKINPYDKLPLHRKLIDKKNKKIGFFDLGNHILIIGMIFLAIFISLNAD
jgi:hypothetical protein|tara:strand:- start:805 stop:1065 length:261 start_codon:yes stop_codon:yes gene_type:complete